MTSHFRVLPSADGDLDGQAEYLAREAGLETALRFLDAASETFERFAGAPGLGERWDSVNPRLAGLRVASIEGFPNHLVFYRTTSDGIEVVRVLHGARDIDRVLESEQKE